MVQQVIAEHSVCLDLLPTKARILDAGCRGMEFTNFFRDKGHKVIALDIDDIGDQKEYTRAGIGSISGFSMITPHSDPQARRLDGIRNRGMVKHENEVCVFTLEELEAGEKFDLIKLDVEGEEMMILPTVKHPIAKQVSVEFHAHCGRHSKKDIDDLLDMLSEHYTIYNRVWESRHGCSPNYWDILLIAK